MGNLSGAVGHLKKELKRAQQDVQRFSAALAALGNSHSNGGRILSADARNRISLAQKKRWAKVRKGSQPAAKGSENNWLCTREAHHVSISPEKDRRRSKARWAK